MLSIMFCINWSGTSKVMNQGSYLQGFLNSYLNSGTQTKFYLTWDYIEADIYKINFI